MLRRLRSDARSKGKLTTQIIKNAPGLPSVACYIKHFGSLRKAYALIGYQGSRDCDWFDARDYWSELLSKLAAQVAEALKIDLGIRLNLTDDGAGLARHGSKDHLVSGGPANGAEDFKPCCSVESPPEKGTNQAVCFLAAEGVQQGGSRLCAVARSRYCEALSNAFRWGFGPPQGRSRRHCERTYSEHRSEIQIVQPCRAIQANATEQAKETMPAQNQERPSRGADGTQIENRAQDLAVVSPEIAIELRNLDELGTLVGHYILLETPQVPHSVNADRS